MRRVALLIVFVTGATNAAEHPAVGECRAERSKNTRIACLERALNATYEQPPVPAAAPPPPPVPVAESIDATSVSVAATVARPVEVAIQADETDRVPPRMSEPPVQPEFIEAQPTEPEFVEVQRAEPEPVAGLGAEQVESRRERAEKKPDAATGLRVASYATVPYQRLQVTLENGQVWRQIEGDVQRFRVDLKRNQTVDIVTAPISGYRLRLNEINRTIRVERIR